MELRKKFTSRLPATPCTPELRQKVEVFAQTKGCHIAEVQRAALSLFFDQNDIQSIIKDTENVTESIR